MDLFLTANDNDNDDDNYWLVERLKKHTLSQKKQFSWFQTTTLHGYSWLTNGKYHGHITTYDNYSWLTSIMV